MTVTLESLQGRVLDVDSHEQIPTPRWAEMFGDRAQRFADESARMFEILKGRTTMRADIEETDGIHLDVHDTERIAPETVWEKKGVIAPSAIDLNRRPEAMDAMGFQRELVFPMMALAAMSVTMGGVFYPASDQEIEAAFGAIDAHNEWAAELTKKYPDRLRPVGVLPTWRPDATPESLTKEAERLIASGLRVLQITPTVPPIGLSPAAPDLDPFYAMVAAANVALVTHPHPPGRNGGLISDRWLRSGGVSPAAPGAEENFIAMLTLGGVFERHPTLRIGVIESGSQWIGPLAEKLDFVTDASVQSFPTSQYSLPMKPSEYLARNVRVSALLDDPVERWLERYPHIQDVYCYSSDFPHIEGRPHSLKAFYERVAPLGDDVVEKFFCTNAELLLS